jgi:hypothetical protein
MIPYPSYITKPLIVIHVLGSEMNGINLTSFLQGGREMFSHSLSFLALKHIFFIEIRLEQACIVTLVYFFSSFEHAKTADYGSQQHYRMFIKV